jgi:hypothetical protein
MESLTKFAKQLNGKNWRFNSGLPARNLVIIDRQGIKKPEIQHLIQNEYHMVLLPHLIGKRRSDECGDDKVHWYIKVKDNEPIKMSVPVDDSRRVFDFALSMDASMVAVMP